MSTRPNHADFQHVLSAGFNQLRYDFSLTELDASTTAVRCTVHCYTSPGGQGQTASQVRSWLS